jgi:putative ABC transport system substrate-binding protein
MTIKTSFYIVVSLLVSFIALGLYFENPELMRGHLAPQEPIKREDSKKAFAYTRVLKVPKESYSIAIMVPATHPSLEKISGQFIATIQKQIKADCTVYNAQANRALMRAQAEEIVARGYDLVFTVGAGCSLMAQEVTSKKQSAMPIVFGAVSRPHKLNLTNTNITGVSEERDYQNQCDLLVFLKPTTKTVLLVYDPSQGAGLHEDKNELEQIFNSKNIVLTTIEIDKTSSLANKVAGLLAGNTIDVLLVLKDNTVVAGIETLVSLCNRAGVTLCVSELDSISKGAALAYGVEEASFGQAGAEKALEILQEHKHPSEIPITPLDSFHCIVNSDTMAAQNLVLDKNIEFLMKSATITGTIKGMCNEQ